MTDNRTRPNTRHEAPLPRVLLIAPWHPQAVPGGSQLVAYWLFNALHRSRTHTPYFLAGLPHTSPIWSRRQSIRRFHAETNEYVFRTSAYDHFWQRNDDLALVESFSRFLMRIKPDIVNFHHFSNLGVEFLSLTRRLLPDARIVMSLHDSLALCAADGRMIKRHGGKACQGASPRACRRCFPEHPEDLTAVRKQWFLGHLSAADACVTVTRTSLAQYEQWGLPGARLEVIENGIPSRRKPRAARATTSSPVVIGYFGQLVDSKGLGTLLTVASRLAIENAQRIRIELNGDNLDFASEPLQSRFKAMITLDDVATRTENRIIRYNGPYDAHNVMTKMQRVDWVIIPSIVPESYCLVLSEAWACSRPVIVADAGALGARVTDGDNGVKFPPGNADALHALLTQVARDPQLARTIKAAIRPPRTVGAMLTEYRALYDRLAAPPPEAS